MGAAFTECEHRLGGHLRPELLILEVIDKNGNDAKNVEQGEVVVSTLGVEGMPLLRYKTGDVCKIYYDKCKCGRNTPRLGPVLGRKKQMLKYKGTTVFPPAIFDVLDMIDYINLYQLEIHFDEYKNDDLIINLPKNIENKEKDVKSLFRSKLRVVPKFQYFEKEDLKRKIFIEEKRKPTKIIDFRI